MPAPFLLAVRGQTVRFLLASPVLPPPSAIPSSPSYLFTGSFSGLLTDSRGERLCAISFLFPGALSFLILSFSPLFGGVPCDQSFFFVLFLHLPLLPFLTRL